METTITPSNADADILFSRTVKAGQRIYYVDVKKNKRGEKYLSITESKKMVTGGQDNQHVTYEKHKIFLFAEDFQKFQDSLTEAMAFAQNDEEDAKREENGEIHIDMDFPTEL